MQMKILSESASMPCLNLIDGYMVAREFSKILEYR